MIQPRSIVKIADNTGAKVGRIFKIPGGSMKRTAGIGEIVIFNRPLKNVEKQEIEKYLSQKWGVKLS